MRIDRIGGFFLTLVVVSSAVAQENNLNRAEVAAIKAKLVTVQQAMGADPTGYVKEAEDFNLPTEVSPGRQQGKYWPMSASVSLRYTDRAEKEGTENLEQMNQEFQQRYAAALASGDPNAILRFTEEMTKLQQQAAATAMVQPKQPMDVYVYFNSSPYATIDPDAVVFESPGVIALRDADLAEEEGTVTVYLDPVALRETGTLSSLELKTPEDGVSNRTGVFNIVITLNGPIADAEAWAKTFDTASILSVIDSQ